MKEINLSNLSGAEQGDLFEDQLEVNRINQQLHQESKLKGVVREFTIFNDDYLHQLSSVKHHGKREFHIKLEFIDEKPEYELTIPYDWLITTVISTLVTLLMLYIFWFSTLQIGMTTAYLISAFSVTFSAIVFLFTILKTENRVQLFSRYGHIPIVELINKNPTADELSKFVSVLSQYIVQAQQRSNLSTKEQLSLELKELRRLQKTSIISLEEYEQAKELIFNHRAFKSQPD